MQRIRQELTRRLSQGLEFLYTWPSVRSPDETRFPSLLKSQCFRKPAPGGLVGKLKFPKPRFQGSCLQLCSCISSKRRKASFGSLLHSTSLLHTVLESARQAGFPRQPGTPSLSQLHRDKGGSNNSRKLSFQDSRDLYPEVSQNTVLRELSTVELSCRSIPQFHLPEVIADNNNRAESDRQDQI